jgi:hypothetical protein
VDSRQVVIQLGRSVRGHQLLTGKGNQFIAKCYAGLQSWSDSFELRMQRKMDMRFGTQKTVTFVNWLELSSVTSSTLLLEVPYQRFRIQHSTARNGVHPTAASASCLPFRVAWQMARGEQSVATMGPKRVSTFIYSASIVSCHHYCRNDPSPPRIITTSDCFIVPQQPHIILSWGAVEEGGNLHLSFISTAKRSSCSSA